MENKKGNYYVEGKDFKSMNTNLKTLVNILNHRVTKLEVHVRWTTRVIGYIAALITLMAGKTLFFS